jgi:hypothetical protein
VSGSNSVLAGAGCSILLTANLTSSCLLLQRGFILVIHLLLGTSQSKEFEIK